MRDPTVPWDDDDSDYARGYRDAVGLVLGALTPQTQDRWIGAHLQRNAIMLGLPEHTLTRVRRYLCDLLGVEEDV